MAITAPIPIVLPFATDGLKNEIPVDSQIGIVNGAASYTDGFPPLNMTAVSSGGIPPSGKDMNGILFAVTTYCQWIQAGGQFQFDADLVAQIVGYPAGAVLQSSVLPYQHWTNLVEENDANPDADNTGWLSDVPLYVALPLTAGQHDDLVLPGPSDYVIDYTLAGAADITGWVAQRDGQTLYLSNVDSANLLQLLALTGSAAGNQIRAATDLGAIQNQTLVVKYSAGAGKWLLV